MTITDLLEIGRVYGTPGMFIAYMIWRELRLETMSKERINADLQLATSLALLKEAISGIRH